jgi:diguanylate cyclase (GGDEF)-like protein
LVDVDHFKHFNDAFGHIAGDECLRRIARTLDNGLTRRGEFVARYGGEEFVVVLPASDERTGSATAERLRLAVAGLEMPTSSTGEPYVTVSIGQASSNSGADSGPANLLASADAALYRAKTLGRNRVEGEAAPNPSFAVSGSRAVYAS